LKTDIQHIGFILDGNRRWAEDRNMTSFKGHQQGYENLKMIVKYALTELKVPFVSAYIFSTENWRRAEDEVSFLMGLATKLATRDIDELHNEGIKVVWLGTRERLSDKVKRAIESAEEKTKDNTGGTLGLCFNYGGRQEIVDAVNKIDGEVTEESISANLYGPQIPDIDLMVRTSGEQRISNFMLWRMAYSEMLFVDKFWPDFSKDDLDQALTDYNSRHRRFGE